MYMNLTIRDLFGTMRSTDISDLFGNGLRDKNVVLALSSLEELMQEDEIILVQLELSYAFKHNYLQPETQFYLSLAKTLCGYGRKSKALGKVGKLMAKCMIYADPSSQMRCHLERTMAQIQALLDDTTGDEDDTDNA